MRRVRFAISHFVAWYLRYATHSALKIRQMLFPCTIRLLSDISAAVLCSQCTMWAEAFTIRTNRGRIRSSGKSKNHSTMEFFAFVNRPVAANTGTCSATCQTIHKLYWTQDWVATKVWQQWVWLRDYEATDIKNSFYIYFYYKTDEFYALFISFLI